MKSASKCGISGTSVRTRAETGPCIPKARHDAPAVGGREAGGPQPLPDRGMR